MKRSFLLESSLLTDWNRFW